MESRCVDNEASATTAAMIGQSQQMIRLDEQFGAHNYHPLPVVISEGCGAWVTDVEGKRYLDMLSAYSALNFGHNPPRIVEALKEQLGRLSLTSRAFHNDQLPHFCKELAQLCGMEMVLPMNTGAEAVETAIKTARKWGYRKKGVASDKARIIVFEGNFHGRTTTIVGFSNDPVAHDDYGPFAPGFDCVAYGDLNAVRDCINDETVGILVEPIQGEAGVVIPPEGFLRGLRELCTKQNCLLIADEVQTGLGRTGRLFASDHEDVKPDIYVLGKALGGGLLPVSAVVSTRDILGVFEPGSHGSTFGGNPLAAAVGRAVIELLTSSDVVERSQRLGDYFLKQLRGLRSSKIDNVRGRGLFIGVQLKRAAGTARPYCEQLMQRGLLCKDTHEQVIRFAPPLVVEQKDLDWAMERISEVLSD